MKKYVVSILTFIVIFGFTASNISNNTEAAGNYKISEINYISSETRVPPQVPLYTSTSGVQNFKIDKKVYGNEAFREHSGLDHHIDAYSSQLTRWVDPEQLECMALNIYFESAVEPLAGKLAVSQVVLNRVKQKNWPSTVCDVIKEGPTYKNWKGNVYPIKDRCQFSWWCDGKPDVPHPGRVWENSKKVAKLVMTNNRMVDITEGSTHYHAEYVAPRWSTRMNKVGRIGAHYFYKSKSY